jgi:hypothetical protein
METHEPISPDEAMVALAAAESSRRRVAWAGFPAWYWLATGALLGAVAYGISLPGLWDLAVVIPAAVLLSAVARAGCRARGICEGYVRSAMTMRDTLLLYGPSALVIIAAAAAWHVVSWAPAVAAVVVFALFAGTGLVLGARAARP